MFTRIKVLGNNKSNLLNKPAGGICKAGYNRILLLGKLYIASRLAWLYVYGEYPKYDIDHINGIKSDDSIRNLRTISKSGNMQNRSSLSLSNSTGFLGVRKMRDKFAAEITVNKKRIHLGTFNTVEEASSAYIEAKKKLHTEWRRG